MGIKYGQGRYYGTRGSITKTYYQTTTKRGALANVPALPASVQSKARDFFRGGSNAYDSFSVSQDTSLNHILIMEKPGNVPGSRAIYFKIIGKDGKTSRVYKETYGPDGNLIHTKNK